MEQQVKILKLDAELVQARRVLAEMRWVAFVVVIISFGCHAFLLTFKFFILFQTKRISHR
jgi:hypothetical protein